MSNPEKPRGVPIPEAIRTATNGFVGREWVLDDVYDWLNNGQERFMLITGDPGTGKTAFAAWLAGAGPAPKKTSARNKLERVRGSWWGAHFCSHDSSALGFANSLSVQLARYKPFALALTRAGIPNVVINARQTIGTAAKGARVQNVSVRLNLTGLDPKFAFDLVVREPLKAVCTPKFKGSIVILVDGLDEALGAGSTNIVSLVADTDGLPSNVRFLLTSRNEQDVLDAFKEFRDLNLSAAENSDNRGEDIGQYIAARRKQKQLAARLAAVSAPQKLEDAIVERADGNFLYAKFLLDEIAEGKRSPASLAKLPHGLYDLYRQFLDRLKKQVSAAKPSRGWEEQLQPLLGCISVAIPAAPEKILPLWLGRDVQALLHDIGQLVKYDTNADGGYRLYHLSIADFLASPSYEQNGRHVINQYNAPPAKQHERIINYYVSRFGPAGDNWKDCDLYGLRCLVQHMQARLELTESESERKEQAQQLYAVILNKSFRDAQLSRLGDQHRTLADLRNTLRVALELDDLVKALECVGVYRDIKHSLFLTNSIFKAAMDGDFDSAIERTRHYQILPKLLVGWARALQLYLVWEAAEQGNTRAVHKIMAAWDAPTFSESVWIDELGDAFLVRIAGCLARNASDARDAKAWLTKLAPRRDADSLLKRHQIARSIAPGQRAKLLDKLNAGLREFRKSVDENSPEAISEKPFLDEEQVGAEAAGLRNLLSALAATGEGKAGIQEALRLVRPNPYPRYRDIGFVALGTAALAVPDAEWLRAQLQTILETALNREGVAHSFDLPAVLLQEAKKRKVPAHELSRHLDRGLESQDRWGTAVRARSAHAAALHWQNETKQAVKELQIARRLDTGFAGYGTLTLLALANRCIEFGESVNAQRKPGGSENIASLLAEARARASQVRDEQFRQERETLVNKDYAGWSAEATPNTETMLATLSQITEPDVRMMYMDLMSARWASANSRNIEGLGKLVPVVSMSNATALDAVLGRLFGASLEELDDNELTRVIELCSTYLLTELPPH